MSFDATLDRIDRSSNRRANPMRTTNLFAVGLLAFACCWAPAWAAAASLRNDVYELTLQKDHGVQIAVKGLAPQTLSPRFNVDVQRERSGLPPQPFRTTTWHRARRSAGRTSRRISVP